MSDHGGGARSRRSRAMPTETDRDSHLAAALDCDLDDAGPDPMLEMEIGLPLSGENFVTGEPRITVDYFHVTALERDAVAAGLLDLDGAHADVGAEQTRILLFDGAGAKDAFDVRDLVAILTVRETEIAVETSRSDVTDRVRRRVEGVLGRAGRHLRRVSVDPFEA